MRYGILFLWIIFSVSAALADEVLPDGYSKAYGVCIDQSGGVTAAMRDCNRAEYQRQDKRLNANYKKAMVVISREQQTALRDAQRKWLAYQNAHCDLIGTLSGGTMDLLNMDGCYLEKTKQRADELKQFSDIMP